MKTIYLAGGGTGGHVFPMVALAEILQLRECTTVLVALADRIDRKLMTQVEQEVEYQKLPRPGKGILRKTRFAAVAAYYVLYWLFRLNKWDQVVSSGGYGSVSIIMAAILRRLPVTVYEPNAVDGKVIRWFGRLPGVQVLRPLANLDVPLIRQKLWPSGAQLPEQDRNLLLVMGGSQGSVALNRMVLSLRSELLKQPQLKKIYWIAGEIGYDEVLQTVHDDRIEVVPFTHDVQSLLKRARLVIARAGAGSVLEFVLWRVPAVFVPLPWAADDHQRANARMAAARGWGGIVEESDPASLMIATKTLLSGPLPDCPASWKDANEIWAERCGA